MKKISFMVLIFSGIFSGVFAQSEGRVKMKLAYNAAMPLGDFKSSYISNTSFRGVTGEIGYWFNPKLAIGVQAGYQSYYQKYGRQVYKLDGNQTMSAVLSNTLEMMPVLVNGTFSPLAASGKLIQPYVSAGVGLNMISYTQYYGEFSNGNTHAGFTAQAGAGLMVPLGSRLNNANLQLGATYNYVPYNRNGLKNLNNAGVQVGVVFPLK